MKEKQKSTMQDEYILQNETKQERINILTATAEKREDYSYSKPFTIEELENMKDDFAQKSIMLSEVQDEFDNIKEQFKEKMKPLKSETSVLLSNIKTKAQMVTEQVFLLANQEDGIMEYRNADGYLLHFRKLLPEEKQTRLQIKSGTNN